MKLSEFIEKLEDFRDGLSNRYSECSDPPIYFLANEHSVKMKNIDIEHDEHPGILVRFE